MKYHTIRELELNKKGIRLEIETYCDIKMKSELRVYHNPLKGVTLDFIKFKLKEAGNDPIKLAKIVNYLFNKRFRELNIGLKYQLNLD